MLKLKERKWRDHSHMLFESGYRAFDGEVDLISRGNVISRVQHSTHVRAWDDDNGLPGVIPPGKCRESDIEVVGGRNEVPAPIRDWLDSHKDEEAWIYRFSRRNGSTVGWILVDRGHTRAVRRVISSFLSPRKCSLALLEAEKYIIGEEDGSGEPRN